MFGVMETFDTKCNACGDDGWKSIAGNLYCRECFLELRYGVIPRAGLPRPGRRLTRMDLIRAAERAPDISWTPR